MEKRALLPGAFSSAVLLLCALALGPAASAQAEKAHDRKAPAPENKGEVFA